MERLHDPEFWKAENIEEIAQFLQQDSSDELFISTFTQFVGEGLNVKVPIFLPVLFINELKNKKTQT